MSLSQRPNVKFDLLVVNPHVVKQWKPRTANYRRLSPNHLADLIENMKASGFIFNGAPFIFNSKGELIDGQHRVDAIIETGVEGWAMVIRGLDDDSAIDEDVKTRGISDMLQNKNETNRTALAGALICLYRVANGAIPGDESGGKVPKRVLMRLLGDNPTIRDSVSFIRRVSSRLAMSPSISSWLHYVLTKAGIQGEAEKFFDLIRTGENLAVDDPILRFREAMIRNVASKAKLPRSEQAALLILAWNFWIQGKTCRKLGWNQIGPYASEFPKPITEIAK